MNNRPIVIGDRKPDPWWLAPAELLSKNLKGVSAILERSTDAMLAGIATFVMLALASMAYFYVDPQHAAAAIAFTFAVYLCAMVMRAFWLAGQPENNIDDLNERIIELEHSINEQLEEIRGRL